MTKDRLDAAYKAWGDATVKVAALFAEGAASAENRTDDLANRMRTAMADEKAYAHLYDDIADHLRKTGLVVPPRPTIQEMKARFDAIKRRA